MKTQRELFFIIIILLLVFAVTTSAPVDNDMWWHLRAGQEMWQQGRILLTDQFSHTRQGEPWVNAFWLADLALFGVWQISGFFGIAIIVSMLAVMAALILLKHMEAEASPPTLQGLLILLAFMGAVANWTPRPQLISFLLLAGLDYFLHQHLTNKRKPLWVLPLLFAAWANLHGGFIWGTLLLLATLAGEFLNRLLKNPAALSWQELWQLTLWSLLAQFAILFNPNGTALWQLPFQQVEVSLAIQEWLSPNFHQFYAHPLLWLLFLLILGLGYGKKNISPTDLFKGLGFAYLFFFAQRNLVAFAIIITPITARHLTPALEQLAKNLNLPQKKQQVNLKLSRIINLFITGFLTAVFLVYSFVVSHPQNIAKLTPQPSSTWLKESKLPGPLFNSYNWGGYLTWAVPEYPVFIDGRADLYGNKIISDWMQISDGSPQALTLLDHYNINLIYIEAASPLLQKLSPQHWSQVYADPQFVIYQRIP